jgi:hypothetical protein
MFHPYLMNLFHLKFQMFHAILMTQIRQMNLILQKFQKILM